MRNKFLFSFLHNHYQTRWTDAIIFPKTKFEEILSKTYERMMPTIEYLVWRDQIKSARSSGWTIQERYFNSFFRGYKNIFFQAYAQSIHPWGYIERQRGDAFVRRVETLLPGIEAPAWAYNQRRTPDLDFESLYNVATANQTLYAEATPKPHYNSTDWNNIAHIFNQRFQGGYYAQRLFFNEEIKGDKYNLGPYDQVEKNLLNSWYANADNSYLWKVQNYSDAQVNKLKENAEKWINLIDQHYPEYKDIPCESITHKFNEPHYERNVTDIRRAILSEKWVSALESQKFTNEEVEEIKQFFYTEGMAGFFQEDANGQIVSAPLMTKLGEALGFPNISSLNRFTGEVPELQFNRLLEVKLGINFYTVNSYKKNLVTLTDTDDFRKLAANVKGFSLRALVGEEVYNPLFRRALIKKAKNSSVNGSYVVEALKANPNELNNLINLFYSTREELGLFNHENYQRFLHKVRRVVSTFNFVPK